MYGTFDSLETNEFYLWEQSRSLADPNVLGKCFLETIRSEKSFRSLFTGQPSYLPELSGPQSLEDGRAETQNRLQTHQALCLVGYEPNHDELRCERKQQVSTPSRKKCGHLRRKESLEASQRVQVKPTSTRPEVIDTTRQRQHREDHEDGNRYCGGSRRQTVCICPVVIHQKQPPTLHLTTKRRTTTFSRCAKGA